MALTGSVLVLLWVAVRAPELAPQVTIAFALLAVPYATRRRLAPAYLSPVTIASTSLVAIGLAGTFFYRRVQDAPLGGGITVRLLPETTEATLNVLLAAAGALLAGALVTVWVAKPVPKVADYRFGRLTLKPSTWGLLLLAALMPGLVTVFATGGNLLRRAHYIEFAVQSGGLAGLASQLSIAAVLALGFLFAVDRSSGRRLLVVGALAVYLLLFFAAGSRRLSLLPILFTLGLLVGRPSKRNVIVLGAAVVAALWLIQVPLYLRSLSSHGLLPYLQALPAIGQYEVGWDSIAKNVLISFGIVGATAFYEGRIPTENFWVAINPAGGQAAGWYDIAPTMRLNVYTPYAGVGELANYGWAYLLVYFAAAGVLLGLLDLQAQRLLRDRLPILALAGVGLTALFVLYSIQYNLRPATRMLLYAMAAAVAVEWLSRRLRQRASPTSSPRSAASPSAPSDSLRR